MINLSFLPQAGGYCPPVGGCWRASVLPATQTVETGRKVALFTCCAFVCTRYCLQLCNSHCTTLYVSIRPSHILLSSGVPSEVAANAMRLSVGRGTTKADVDAVVEDLRETVQLLEEMN